MAERTNPPTIDELEKLPRHARTVYALRCAMRVQPLVRILDPENAQLHAAVDNAITLTQYSAASPGSVSHDQLATAHGDAAVAASRALDADDHTASAASDADAATAAYAAYAAAYAADAAHGATIPNAFAADPAHAMRARDAATVAGDATDSVSEREHIRDYELLRRMADREEWTDETPVDVMVLGPLWPHGEPERWPEEAKEDRHEETEDDDTFVIELELPDDATKEEVDAAVREAVRRLDTAHRSSGGGGITARRSGALTDAVVRAGAPA